MRLVVSSFLTLLYFTTGAHAASGVVAGAIRWDAWYNPTGSSLIAQTALGPAQYQSRAPASCIIASKTSISCIGTQDIMDAEIKAAATGGLKYWAFAQYSPSSSLTTAWNLYQNSNIRDKLNWCWITTIALAGQTGKFTTQMDLLAAQMHQSSYQKVTVDGVANRPVVYILWSASDLAGNFGGSYANFALAITYLRSRVVAAGFGTPYIVIQTGVPEKSATIMASVGADAIGAYNTPLAATSSDTYASLDIQTQAFWVKMSATKQSIVPIVMSGFDSSPRIALQSLLLQKPGASLKFIYRAGTTTQLVSEIKAAVSYINSNPTLVPSKLLLVYSWTECDEGGNCLVPTKADPTGARLKAISSAIN